MVIKRLKQWCLRCASCFTVTFDMSKMFCGKCGNNTLERISCSVRKDGASLVATRSRSRRLTACKAAFSCAVAHHNLLFPLSLSLSLHGAHSGQYKLHFRKKTGASRGPNLMGSKYSIPVERNGITATGKKRFEGQTILREDQMMMGVWSQKLRKQPKAAESMFGEDILSDVGLSLKSRKDVKIGHGRNNRNAMRGRERRGKKKSTRSNR